MTRLLQQEESSPNGGGSNFNLREVVSLTGKGLLHDANSEALPYFLLFPTLIFRKIKSASRTEQKSVLLRFQHIIPKLSFCLLKSSEIFSHMKRKYNAIVKSEILELVYKDSNSGFAT